MGRSRFKFKKKELLLILHELNLTIRELNEFNPGNIDKAEIYKYKYEYLKHKIPWVEIN